MGCSIPQASLLGCMHLEGQLVQGAQVQNGNCILEGHQNLDLMNSNGSCRQEHQALDPGTLLFSISSTGWSRLVVIGRRERWAVIYWVLLLVVLMTWYCSYLYIQIPSRIIKILCPLMQYEELGIHDMNLIFSPIFFLESGCESTWPGSPALCRRSACPRPQRNPRPAWSGTAAPRGGPRQKSLANRASVAEPPPPTSEPVPGTIWGCGAGRCWPRTQQRSQGPGPTRCQASRPLGTRDAGPGVWLHPPKIEKAD